MASQQISEPNEKNESRVSSPEELPTFGGDHIHVVPRTEEIADYDKSGTDSITGYNATLMGARVTLSNEEEKKLLRRIDWHLIPLMSLIYMIKSVDFTNVRKKYPRTMRVH